MRTCADRATAAVLALLGWCSRVFTPSITLILTGCALSALAVHPWAQRCPVPTS